jgi:hypothetical protein
MFTHTNDQFERAKFMTGYSDLAAGQVGGDASGRTVAFATENESRQRRPIMALHTVSMTEVMQHCLYLARQFYDEGRVVKLIGEDGRLEATEFYSEDFDAANDLVVDVFSGAPASHAARFSQTLEMMGAGLFGDTPEAERARRAIGADYATKNFYDPFQRDRERARREQLVLLQNPMAQLSVKSYDIHKTHLEEHNEFRKTIEYEELPPWLQQKFDQHCDLHSILDNGVAVQSMGMQVPSGDIDSGGGLPGASQPGPQPQAPEQPAPQDGGHAAYPGPPPTVHEFANMSPQEQKATDQK